MNENIFLNWKKEFEANNLTEAIKILEAENKNKPNDLQCLYHLGFTWRFIGDFEKAENYYLEALQIAPDDDSINLGVGVVYQMKGDFDKAIKYLEKATTNPQFNVNAFNSLGLTYKKKGDLDKAIEIYLQGIKHLFENIYQDLSQQKVIKLIPHKEVNTNEWLRFSLEAILRGATKDGMDALAWPTGEQAMRFYEEAKDAPCWTDIEKTRRITPQYLEAVRERLSSNLMYSLLTNNLGSAFGKKNDIAEAKKWFLESIAFIPDDVNYPDPKMGLEELEKTQQKIGKKFFVVPQSEEEIESNRKKIEELRAKGLLQEHEKTFKFLPNGTVVEIEGDKELKK
jgi:tetratricopeptide (TPR) repeat protein